MDDITKKVQDLNEIYHVMQAQFNILKKLFKDDPLILQRTKLSEALLDNVYMSVLDKLESEEITKEFAKIVKSIQNKDK